MAKLTANTDLIELLDNLDPVSVPLQNHDDPLPEDCVYTDEGCELSPSCLECPFAQCVYDRPWGRIKLNTNRRDSEIRRFFQQDKMTVTALVKKFAVSERTVRRAIKDTPPPTPNKHRNTSR